MSAIQWEGCSPVFCDIDPETLNMDPAKIEALITDKTVAIMPVHVFGNPCDVDAVQAIARGLQQPLVLVETKCTRRHLKFARKFANCVRFQTLPPVIV